MGRGSRLVDLLGVQGAVEFRALLDGFPEAVGVLWALRDARGRIVDFRFGYGNPTILRAFRLPAATRDRYTLWRRCRECATAALRRVHEGLRIR